MKPFRLIPFLCIIASATLFGLWLNNHLAGEFMFWTLVSLYAIKSSN